MRPLLIGLTGGIGTGKSSVAALLQAHGAQVVSGDELGRIALEQSPELMAAIRERFGDEVYSGDGTLLRKELSIRVFDSCENAKWLTDLTFPRIHELWLDKVRSASHPVVVFDAALIAEWGIEREFDHLVVVTVASDTARLRLAQSGRLSHDEIRARQAIQVDLARQIAAADVVIQNDGSMENLQRQVDDFWRKVIDPELQRRRDQEHARSD